MKPEVVLVKASPLRALLHFMDDHLTPQGRDRALQRASAEFPVETSLRGHMPVATERVPVLLVNRLIELTAEEMREPAPVVAHRLGRVAAEEASTGVMRLAMILISIPNLLRKLAPVWSQVYTHGKVTSACTEREANVELTDFPIASATGCARITGWFEWFAERAEKTARVRHVECRSSGASVCRWQITW